MGVLLADSSELANIAANARRGKTAAAISPIALEAVGASPSATLIMTAKLNDVDLQAWLAEVLARIADHRNAGTVPVLYMANLRQKLED